MSHTYTVDGEVVEVTFYLDDNHYSSLETVAVAVFGSPDSEVAQKASDNVHQDTGFDVLSASLEYHIRWLDRV